MLRKRPLTIFCSIIGAACIGVGALVLGLQIAEWWSFGDWNAVSVRYVLGYFSIPVISGNYGLLDLPASLLFLSGGALVVLLGAMLPRRDNTSQDISK